MKRQHQQLGRASAGGAQSVVVADNHGGPITRLASFCQCNYSGYRVSVRNESTGCIQRLQHVAVDQGRVLGIRMRLETLRHCA